MSRPEDGRVQEGVVHFSDDEHMNNGYARLLENYSRFYCMHCS